MKLIEKKAREFAEGNLLDNDEIWTFPEQVKVYKAGWRACREQFKEKATKEGPCAMSFEELENFGEQEVGE